MTAQAGSELRGKAEEAVAAAMDVAADMGIPQIALHSVGASFIRSRDELRDTAHCLRLACALAKRRGIRVDTENALDGETLKALVRIVGYDNLRCLIHLAGHSRRGGEAVFDALPAFLDVYDGAYVKDGIDGQPCPLGEGLARVDEHVAAFRLHGWGGTLFLENDYTARAFGPELWEAIRRDAAYIIRTER